MVHAHALASQTSLPLIDRWGLLAGLTMHWEFARANCFQCMKCTSGCTALKLLELKPNGIIKLVNLGFVDELPSSDIIWTCVTCLKCVEMPTESITVSCHYSIEESCRRKRGKSSRRFSESRFANTGNRIGGTSSKNRQKKDGNYWPRMSEASEIKSPKESFQAIFMKAMEEK